MRRQIKPSILVYTEGLSEANFLKHLRQIYNKEYTPNIKIITGHGGSVTNIVSNASHAPGEYTRRFVIVDTDKPHDEIAQAEQRARESSITILANHPCLEAVLLSILQPGPNYKEKSSTWCKRTFQEKYINYRSHPDKYAYLRTFPLALLERAKSRVPELENMVALFNSNRSR